MDSISTRRLLEQATLLVQQLNKLQAKFDNADIMTKGAGEKRPTPREYRIAAAAQLNAIMHFLGDMGVTIPTALETLHFDVVRLARDDEVSPLLMSEKMAEERKLGENPRHLLAVRAKANAAAALEHIAKRKKAMLMPEAANLIAETISGRGFRVTGRAVKSWRGKAVAAPRNEMLSRVYWATVKALESSDPAVSHLLQGLAEEFASMPQGFGGKQRHVVSEK
jgi:hypothetical protein